MEVAQAPAQSMVAVESRQSVVANPNLSGEHSEEPVPQLFHMSPPESWRGGTSCSRSGSEGYCACL